MLQHYLFIFICRKHIYIYMTNNFFWKLEAESSQVNEMLIILAFPEKRFIVNVCARVYMVYVYYNHYNQNRAKIT